MKKFLGIIVLCVLFGGHAHTHSGGTNSEGCHNQKSNNTYHCHKSKSDSKKISTSSSLRIIDGDTIHIGKNKYRFSGIDTPEIKQTCEKDGALFYCGLKAKEILKEKIANYKITCIEEDELDFFKRILAECFVNGESLSVYMVRSGYAFASRKYSKKFIKDEDFAKENNLGLWKTNFEYPWDFKKKKKK
jgi:endonuclease YncB( thermonuclease family)